MTLRINTNIAAMNAHNNMIKNGNALSSSLQKLSSGLRINKAADDASGMAIADSLRSQSLGLGQAIRNANDGISMVQTADGALEESINIVNTIKTKAIQAAQDGQTQESRAAIQADIGKLLENLDAIAKTTAFNNQKLLSGNFTNKAFQVGAYSGETVNISIASAESTKIGHVTTGKLELANADGGAVQLNIYSSIQDQNFTLQTVNVGYTNNRLEGMGGLADAINKLSDVLGISATAQVSSTSNQAVAAGQVTGLKINDVVIGDIQVQANDGNGALVNAINQKTADHGVVASVDSQGYLTLTASDGRAIKVDGDTIATLGTSEMSTVGHLVINKAGASDVVISGLGVATELDFATDLASAADVTTAFASTLKEDSTIADTSVLAAGTVLGMDLVGTTDVAVDSVTTTQDSILKAGSIVEVGSELAAGTVFGGQAEIDALADTSGNSTLTAGSTLLTGSVLAAGTIVLQDIFDGGGELAVSAGTKLSADYTLAADLVLTSDMTLTKGSTVAANSIVAYGSVFSDAVTLAGTDDMVLTGDMVVKTGSTLEIGTVAEFKAGSTIGFELTAAADLNVVQDMTLAAGSTLVAGTSFANESTLGASIKVAADVTVNDGARVNLAAGSVLEAGSTLTRGTVLSTDMVMTDGTKNFLVAAGTKLEQDLDLAQAVTLQGAMYLEEGSVIAADSVLAAVKPGGSDVNLVDTKLQTLSEISVLTQEGAQQAIAVADSALKDLGKVRADLGSVQNQLTSTIANITVTRVNISAAESAIRDVDFAEEAANFSKFQILNQAGSFAMAQANASSQTVLSLLQG
ncbi:flagellin [Desulfurivibrio sp. D14AmB]|uniref:flagellin N-terminal helical domain-containing protein n=1 Tax=Desulfurivibrio sp. D14AmB TaxID=3374370 RepID=UPI00376F0292